MNFCWKFLLKFASCESIWSRGNTWNSPLPHTLKCHSTFNCWYCGSWMCWWYTLTLSLSLVFLSPVSPIYSSLHLSQMKTYVKLKGEEIIYREIVAAFTSFITTVKRIPDKTSPFSALIKFFLRFRSWRLLCIKLTLWKPLTLLFFKQPRI